MRLKSIISITTTCLVIFMSSCKKDATPVDPTMDTSTDLLDYNADVATNTNKALIVGSSHSSTMKLTNPLNNATSVPLDQIITASFNNNLSPSQIAKSTFTVKAGSTSGSNDDSSGDSKSSSNDDSHGSSTVAGTVSFSHNLAIFTPSVKLNPNTVYTATITSRYFSKSDEREKKAYSWHFSTGAGVSTLIPTISSSMPLNAATGVVFNQPISVNFSEAMDPLTINATTFTVKQGTVAVAGTITYSGTKATFTPTSNFAPNTVYTVMVTTGAKDVSGIALLSNYSFTFTTASALDVIAPTILSADPLNGTTGVALTKVIAINFSESMNASTITSTSFTLKLGATAVAGTVVYSGTKATFTPSASLVAGSVYTGTVTTSAKDLAGNALASNYTFSFTTGAAVDATPPTVTLVDPLNSATGVAVNKILTVSFSEAMNYATLTSSTFTLKQGTTVVAGAVAYAASKATFTPTANLVNGVVYTATITTGAQDVAGNGLASNYTFSFTTVEAADVTPPTVLSTDPLSGATAVATTKVIGMTFSEAMTASTISASTFTLKQGTTAVTGTVAYSGTTATFTPSSALVAGTVYTANLTTGAKDLAGNAISAAKTWSFTTAGTAPAPGLSFATDVMPVLATCENCHTHGWTPSTVASTYYTNLVNAGYVVPASYTTSKIYSGINNGHFGTMIPKASSDNIINWMIQGSKNN